MGAGGSGERDPPASFPGVGGPTVPGQPASSQPVLFSRWQNSAGERVRIAFGLKRVPYRYVPVASLPTGEWRRLNPQGLMPALGVGGRVIAQSTAILEWIEETWPDPPLLPRDPLDRATVRGFALAITADTHPLHNNRVRRLLRGRFGIGEPGERAWIRHWVEQGLDPLERILAARPRLLPFCFGEEPGWADLHLVPQMANVARFGLDPARWKLLASVAARCADLPAFRAARPEAQPDHPGKR